MKNAFITSDNKKVIISEAQEKDAEKIINFARLLFTSTDQVLTTIEEYTITLEQEISWIKTYSDLPTAIILIALHEDQVIGLLDFTTKPRKKVSHTGEFGVSIHPDFRGKGIGRKLIETLLKWAAQTPGVEKIFLNVFATNINAIALYKSLGFIEEGRHVNAIKQLTGEYIDLIEMYKMINTNSI